MRAFLATVLLCLTAAGAIARENEVWEASPAEVRQWFRDLMQPDNPYMSCCGEADAYYADSFRTEGDHYVAIITDERFVPGRPPRAVGTEIVVPNTKLKFDRGNPTGHGVIFLSYSGDVYCYVVPGGV